MSNETSVEQTKEEVKTESAAAANEVYDVDALLAEFDEANETQTQEQQQKVEGNLADEFRQFMQEQKADKEAQQRKEALDNTRKGIEEAVKTVSEVFKENEVEMPAEWVEGLLHAEATRDKRFENAFLKRSQSPRAWQQILHKFAEASAKKAPTFEKKDDQREKIAGAVAQSRSKQKTEDSKDWNSMSDAEFMKEKRRLMGGLG